MNVGANIKARRESLGYSQGYVAEGVGISQAMLCQIERGTKNPSLQVGVGIAKLLDCSVENLLEDAPRQTA